MKILLACSAGMSTSLLESNMRKYIEENGLKHTVEAKDSASAKSTIGEYDIVLLGPQVRFMKDEFSKLTNVPVDIIPMQMYGMVKGEETVKFAEKVMKESK